MVLHTVRVQVRIGATLRFHRKDHYEAGRCFFFDSDFWGSRGRNKKDIVSDLGSVGCRCWC